MEHIQVHESMAFYGLAVKNSWHHEKKNRTIKSILAFAIETVCRQKADDYSIWYFKIGCTSCLGRTVHANGFPKWFPVLWRWHIKKQTICHSSVIFFTFPFIIYTWAFFLKQTMLTKPFVYKKDVGFGLFFIHIVVVFRNSAWLVSQSSLPVQRLWPAS